MRGAATHSLLTRPQSTHIFPCEAAVRRASVAGLLRMHTFCLFSSSLLFFSFFTQPARFLFARARSLTPTEPSPARMHHHHHPHQPFYLRIGQGGTSQIYRRISKSNKQRVTQQSDLIKESWATSRHTRRLTRRLPLRFQYIRTRVKREQHEPACGCSYGGQDAQDAAEKEDVGPLFSAAPFLDTSNLHLHAINEAKHVTTQLQRISDCTSYGTRRWESN